MERLTLELVPGLDTKLEPWANILETPNSETPELEKLESDPSEPGLLEKLAPPVTQSHIEDSV